MNFPWRLLLGGSVWRVGGDKERDTEMNRYQKYLTACAVVVGGLVLNGLCEGEFDPSTTFDTACATVTTIKSKVGTLLGGMALLIAAFFGYRKYREAMNKA